MMRFLLFFFMLALLLGDRGRSDRGTWDCGWDDCGCDD
jgi:hypothetical protein